MRQTVIGVFDNFTEAQQGVQQLISNGLMREHIDITTKQSTGGSGTAMSGNRDEEDEDSISKFFSSLFGSDEGSKYSDAARSSDCIVTVHAQSEEEAHRAARLLDEAGAVDIEERAAQYSQSGQGTARTAGATGAGEAIPVIEERMQVGKREVETGGVRMRSRIVERPVEEHLRLREEHVWVERNPVNRQATDADLTGFKEGEIELTEHAEVPVVSKEARVVEEIRLGKEVEEHDETVRGTIRKTEVDVDRLDERDDLDRTDDPTKSSGL